MKSILIFALGAFSALLFSYLLAIRPLQNSLLTAGKAVRGRHLVEASWLDRIAERIDQGNVSEARRQITERRTMLEEGKQ